jgi:hypothetical protein
MKRVAFALLLTGSVALAGEDRPFGAIETRPLWERPASNDGLTLQQRTEAALDRGTGRIEDQPTFELKQIERQQDRPDGLREYRIERERADRIEQQRLTGQRETQRQQRTEREDESLADMRREWDQIRAREDHAGAAVVDRMALDQMERDYRAALESARTTREGALDAVYADSKLTAAQRQERVTAIDKQYEAARVTAGQAREKRRAIILGLK